MAIRFRGLDQPIEVVYRKSSGSAPQPVDPYTQAAAQYGLSTGTALFNAGLNRTNSVTPLGSSTWSASYDGRPPGPYTPGPDGTTVPSGGSATPGRPSYTTPGTTPVRPTVSPTIPFGGNSNSFGLPGGGSMSIPQNPVAGAPYNGSPTGSPTGGAPTYTNITQLAPQFQDTLNKPIDTSGIIGAPGGPNALDARGQIQDALYKQQSQYLDPQFKLSDEQLSSQLANQGIMPGSEAYRNAMDQANRNKTFAYGNARDQAITGATGQMGQLQQIGLGGFNAGLTARDTPLNEFSSLSGRSAAPVSAQTPDISGAFGQQYQGRLAGYNAQNASDNATNTDVMSLIAAGLMFFSDRRLKTDIEPIGHMANGLTVYRFRYTWDSRRYIGVMADEVEKVLPHAVHTIHGIQLVNYGAL